METCDREHKIWKGNENSSHQENTDEMANAIVQAANPDHSASLQ